MDAIVMLASSRYIKFGDCKTQGEAVEKMAGGTGNIERFAEKDPFPDFKQRFLYNKEVDDMIRNLKDELLVAFKLYSGREDTPGEAKSMSMAEYVELLAALGIDQEITERAVRLSFVRAKETTIDEADSRSKHKKLKFVEFLEVFSRVALAVHCAEKGVREGPSMQIDKGDFQDVLQRVFEEVATLARRSMKRSRTKSMFQMAAAAVAR
ncbi:hypothetical protein TeGR_g2938 [Tetraparma gracilis]|uniref:Uncharacterized protein n=1 Tax=Tetraparma gracilis TaxID=2962635 RepID=A0ABQ6MY19_9STRA|nr:hypothetical protein TeGR_g2938 [Tetraparma gracilis]